MKTIYNYINKILEEEEYPVSVASELKSELFKYKKQFKDCGTRNYECKLPLALKVIADCRRKLGLCVRDRRPQTCNERIHKIIDKYTNKVDRYREYIRKKKEQDR